MAASSHKVFYNWSGGMESSAMLVIDRDRIRDTGAIVRWADTGKHFPEMYESKAQIESLLGLEIVTVPRRITFDEYLFERGGMLRKGAIDCSKRMKRSNLMKHFRAYCWPGTKKRLMSPGEINIGFNRDERDRAENFIDRNERDWCHWRFPLIEHRIDRAMTWEICRKAGFTILVSMYEKMGRFDCFWCPNQTPDQARKVIKHYPELAREWVEAEKKKGHSFMRVPLALVERDMNDPGLFAGCSCFGGTDDVFDDDCDEPFTASLPHAGETGASE